MSNMEATERQGEYIQSSNFIASFFGFNLNSDSEV